ncbi:MAG: T9SS type A sorting domain-containing protein [Candidatus Kapabacteria bacterium]|nr:T9SS type A sorting domain-containing protein [Candidatus Kapabacteria bacterium]
MKTFMLPVLALFLLLSVNNALSQTDEGWEKVDFPDKEVTLIYGSYYDRVFALTTEAEVYTLPAYFSPSVEKININVPGVINSFGNYSGYQHYTILVGTDVGLFKYNVQTNAIDEIPTFKEMKIVLIASNAEQTLVLSESGLFCRGREDTVWTLGKQPGTNEKITEMSIGFEFSACITDSGNFYISGDHSCQTWTKPFDNPDGKPFSAIEFSWENSEFVLACDDGIYIYRDQPRQVTGFDGGKANCFAAMTHGCVSFGTENKNKKLQSKLIDGANFAIGSSEKGVYGSKSDWNDPKTEAVNDNLGNYNIVALSASFGRLYASTKNSGIYMTRYQFGAVKELDLTPYALKISPNPAKTTAAISFHNPEYANIEIAIYDLSGRKVADVHSGNLAEGDYNFSADLSGLASGNYFLRFGVGERVGSLSLIVE